MIPLHFSPHYHIQEQLDIYFAYIDGKKIRSVDELYTQIKIALQFPDSFGHNLDALEEMLNDLEWIEQTAIILLIQNANFLLFSENVDIREEILNIFEVADNGRLEIITLG